MKKEVALLAILFMIASSFLSIGKGKPSFKPLSFTGQIAASTFSANGTLFVGDTNYTLYRSDNNGSSFRQIYTFPNQSNPISQITGYIMTLFIDSRNYIFVSIPGTNRLYRSTDYGTSFIEVLNTNGTKNDGFYIALTEDNFSNLYLATYANSLSILGNSKPAILKSIDGGENWFEIFQVSAVHFHNIQFNPANGYLYAVSGEWALGIDNSQSEQIFRSKDYGQTWTAVIQRATTNQSYGNTIYLPMLFSGNWVYLGSDQAFKANWIDRFYDNGSDTPFTPQRVYTLTETDGNLPFISASWFKEYMIFSSTAEFSNGTAHIISSKDGMIWTTIKTANYTTLQHHANKLTSNANGIIVGSDGPNANFAFEEMPEPSPSPSPSPTIEPTPPPTNTPNPTQTTTPNPTPTPKPKITPTTTPIPIPPTHFNETLIPKPTLQPEKQPESQIFNNAMIALSVIFGTIFAFGLLRKKYKFRRRIVNS